MNDFECKDNNPKVVYVEFEVPAELTNILGIKKEEWKLCEQCALKDEFKNHRIRTEKIGDDLK